MILELARRMEHFGSVRFYDVQRVYELDSGMRKFPTKAREAVATISSEDIEKINQKMAIVVPVKDERLRLLEGVLSGIPHDCHVIVVSGSRRSPVDRFMMEVQLLKRFNHFVGDEILIIHQQDPGLSETFRSAGFDSILNKTGSIRSGKAEAMVIGVLLAKMLGKEYVGFIDADNYLPGAVHEYVEIYAAGFSQAESPFSMVRVSWVHKPKITENGLFFAKFGRVSAVSNECLNLLMSSYTGFETDVIKTANSGEHAMSIKLAELLYYASGFAAETYEIVNLMEQFGGVIPAPSQATSQAASLGVDVFQIESRNPHLHEEKGESHIKEMLLSSIGAIYHSQICPPQLKDNIVSICTRHGFKVKEEEIPCPAKIRPPCELDMNKFAVEVQKNSQTLIELK
ncbi:MAG: mannosyl-3-phosphoglycerate synthase [Candidatus Bathyarchaeia archaeon]|nr:mannosyl-3-phosphoglycerate synthase [Candidatus Bathyarchaeota archaeon]